MDSFIRGSIRNRSLTFFTVFLIVLAGIVVYTNLPQNEDPPIHVRIVQIITYWPGATPEDVELYVSKPLENAVAKQDSIDVVGSQSLPGASVLAVEISEYVSTAEVQLAFQQIRNYVNDAKGDLPDGVVGPFVNDRFGETTAFVMGLVSESENRTYRELESMTEQIRDRVRTVDGVGDFDTYGVQPEKVYIKVDRDRFQALRINPSTIFQAVENRNFQMAQPYIRLSDKKVLIEVTGPYKSIDQIRDTIFYTDNEGQTYRLKDLGGAVEVGYVDPMKKFTRVNGAKSVVFAFSMKRGNNIVKWGKKVDEELEAIAADLPADVKMVYLSHQSEGVREAVGSFMTNFIQAIVIVILVIGIGMGIRNASIVAIAIPLIMLATFVMMGLFKIELHQMSINALIIALGMVVDNAIVIVDNINRYIRMGYKKIDAAFLGASEVKVAIFSGTLTTVAAFLPLALLPGNVGEYIGDLPKVITFALIMSYLVAMFVTPACSVLFLKGGKNHKKKKVKKQPTFFTKVYRWLVDWTHKLKYLTILIVLLLFAGALYVSATKIPKSFFPEAEKSQFTIDVDLPDGWDLAATAKVSEKIEKELAKLQSIELEREPNPVEKLIRTEIKPKPLVTDYVSYIGGSGPRFFIAIAPQADQPKLAQLLINTPSPWHTDEAIKRLKKYIRENVTGARVEIRKLETGPVVAAPIQVKIAGQEVLALKQYAAEIQDILESTRGVTSTSNNFGHDSDKLVINIDQDKARTLGISSEDIATSMYVGFEGYTLSKLKAPERQIDIILRLPADERKNLDDIKAMIFTSSHTGVAHRLDEFATVSLDTYTSSIVRSNQRRTLTINAYVDQRLPSEILKEAKPKIAAIKLAKNYDISYGGQDEASSKAFGDLGVSAVFALMLLLLILSFQFRSIRIGISIYLSIPLAFIGAVGGMYIMKQPLGFMSALGLISLAGIVVNNAIVMIEFIQDYLREGHELIEAIKQAGIVRFKPIMLTTISTLGGLLPLALTGGVLFEPMCWVIIFGLLFSTVLTLLVIPLFYVMLGGAKDSIRLIADEASAHEIIKPEEDDDDPDGGGSGKPPEPAPPKPPAAPVKPEKPVVKPKPEPPVLKKAEKKREVKTTSRVSSPPQKKKMPPEKLLPKAPDTGRIKEKE